MRTRVSTKGQIVLPGPIRRKLDLRPGDALATTVEAVGSRIILTPKTNRPLVIGTDPTTGLPVLTVDPQDKHLPAPLRTNQEAEDILADPP